MSEQPHSDRQSPNIATGRIASLIAGFFAFVGAAMLLLAVFYIKAGSLSGAAAPRPFPAPRLETQNGQELGPLLREQDQKLHEYAWVDRKQQIVRVPIERAMQILAAEGDKGYEPPHQDVSHADNQP